MVVDQSQIPIVRSLFFVLAKRNIEFSQKCRDFIIVDTYNDFNRSVYSERANHITRNNLAPELDHKSPKKETYDLSNEESQKKTQDQESDCQHCLVHLTWYHASMRKNTTSMNGQDCSSLND